MAKSSKTKSTRRRAKSPPSTKVQRRPARKPSTPKPKFRVYDRDGRKLGNDFTSLESAKKSTTLVGASIQSTKPPVEVWKRCPQYWRRDR